MELDGQLANHASRDMGTGDTLDMGQKKVPEKSTSAMEMNTSGSLEMGSEVFDGILDMDNPLIQPIRRSMGRISAPLAAIQGVFQTSLQYPLIKSAILD